MSKIITPRDLLIREIKELYSSENQLIKALPWMTKAAVQADLKVIFTRHLDETKGHARRIEEMMTKLAESPRGKKCRAMEGLLEEGRETIDGDVPPAIRDLALIAAAQKIEHYEIAVYGYARTLADLIGESELADTLQETLDEESTADKQLTEAAMCINIDTGVAQGNDAADSGTFKTGECRAAQPSMAGDRVANWAERRAGIA